MQITQIKATVQERNTTLELTAGIGELEDPIEAAQMLLVIAKSAACEPELGLASLNMDAAAERSPRQSLNAELYTAFQG